MYKFAIAMLLLSTPAFAQDKNEPQPNMPPTNMKNTVIPKSGGEQTPATTPTTAAELADPAPTQTDRRRRVQSKHPFLTMPRPTTTQITGSTDQEPKVKEMNEKEKKKIEKRANRPYACRD